MLAASTAFPWSRWRVLMLDDPTQYNDLIHATALFDVLRNLVRFAHAPYVYKRRNAAGWLVQQSGRVVWSGKRFGLAQGGQRASECSPHGAPRHDTTIIQTRSEGGQ